MKLALGCLSSRALRWQLAQVSAKICAGDLPASRFWAAAAPTVSQPTHPTHNGISRDMLGTLLPSNGPGLSTRLAAEDHASSRPRGYPAPPEGHRQFGGLALLQTGDFVLIWWS